MNLHNEILEHEKKVCDAFGCDVLEIRTKKRTDELVFSRALMYDFLRRKKRTSIPFIARVYQRDISTIKHSLENLKNLLTTNEYVLEVYNKLNN